MDIATPTSNIWAGEPDRGVEEGTGGTAGEVGAGGEVAEHASRAMLGAADNAHPSV